MSPPRKTAIVTGASQGIGAGIVKRFVQRGYNVVANSRNVTKSAEVAASDHIGLVDGLIGDPATAANIVETALSRFKSIDAVMYLTDATTVTGDTLYVDGGSHFGRW